MRKIYQILEQQRRHVFLLWGSQLKQRRGWARLYVLAVSRWLKKEDIRKKRISFFAAGRNQFLCNDWIQRLAQWKHY